MSPIQLSGGAKYPGDKLHSPIIAGIKTGAKPLLQFSLDRYLKLGLTTKEATALLKD